MYARDEALSSEPGTAYLCSLKRTYDYKSELARRKRRSATQSHVLCKIRFDFRSPVAQATHSLSGSVDPYSGTWT
jgi:hypothetical protein